MARSRHDVLDRLGAITCPTLVASGRYDGIAPVTERRGDRGPQSAAPSCGSTTAATRSSPRTRVALPEILEFLAG